MEFFISEGAFLTLILGACLLYNVASAVNINQFNLII